MKGIVRFDEATSLEEAIQKAELDWNVKAEEVFTKDGVSIPDYQAIVKENGAREVLSIMGSRYKTIQNKETFDFLQELTETKELQIVGAGGLRGGRLVYIQSKLPKDVIFGGLNRERHEVYLTAATSHDGSIPLVIVAGLVRIICQNTLMANLKEKNQFRIRHTSNSLNKVAQVREAMKMTWNYVNELQGVSESLIKKTFSSSEMEALTKKLLSFKEEKDEEASTRIQNQVNKIVNNFNEAEDLSHVRGTKWAALNAITHYLDHEKSVKGPVDQREAKRFESSIFGSSATVRQEALELLIA
jgi:phage/plasmid-like protein (TIGR03299 family)